MPQALHGYHRAQENHSGFNILKLVSPEIPNVTIWSVFQNQVTRMDPKCVLALIFAIMFKNANFEKVKDL